MSTWEDEDDEDEESEEDFDPSDLDDRYSFNRNKSMTSYELNTLLKDVQNFTKSQDELIDEYHNLAPADDTLAAEVAIRFASGKATYEEKIKDLTVAHNYLSSIARTYRDLLDMAVDIDLRIIQEIINLNK